MSDQIEIKVNRTFDTSAEQAFDAFLDPDRAAQFLFKTPNGEMQQVEIDPHIGGAFAIIERRPEGDAEHYGTYIEIDRPHTLSFTFGVTRDGAQESMVTLEFKSNGPSSCEITLTNTMDFKFAQFKERTKNGWLHILTGLGKILTPTDHARKIETKDSNGTVLAEGDAVKTIKDLKVKGSSMVVKRGTVVKGIRLVDGSDTEIDCKIDGTSLYLETRWLQKI